MHTLSPQQIQQFQKKILDWYAVNKRDLPWRDVPVGTSLQDVAIGRVSRARDPYKILVSEVMSQQTQISRVIPKFEAWVRAFPTVNDLANATVSSILVYWTGLGYNRRVLNLKRTAEIICKEYNGIFPQNESELLKLPGIGPYTARAVLCFAFNEQLAVVDTNVRKVILTYFFSERAKRVEEPSTSSGKKPLHDKEIQAIADRLLPLGRAYEWNQALMDYAGSVLKQKKIPIPKQSKFIGSHRYYRGQVLKTLLEKKKISVRELGKIIKEDHDEQWLQGLVSELRDEGFVLVDGNSISLAS